MITPSRGRIWRQLVAALAIVAASLALAGPACAQFFEDRPWFDRPRHSPNFPPFFGQRGSPAQTVPGLRVPYVQQSPADSKAPPPRKAETPQTSEVLVIGDSLADWLAYGLEEVFADTPEIGIVRKIRPYSGLVRYEAHNDTLEWPQALKDTLAAEKPKVIVVMLGLNDRQPLRERINQAQKPTSGQNEAASAPSSAEPGQQASGPTPSAAAAPPATAPAANDASRQVQTVSYDFHTDKWAESYGKRIDEMIAALKTNGVPVLWIGVPAMRAARTTGDNSYLNELYRKRAEKAGISYVNIWDGFVDDQGQYTAQGPDFEGQIRRLRSSDGVHFTKYGAEKLAHYIEHDVRRALKRGISVAVPSSEEPNAEGAGTRAAIGPVVPLNDNAVESGELLDAHNGPTPATSESIATRVMSRGDAISAPAGRADNFSWPRADADASIPTTVEVVPVAPVSSVPAAPPASAAKNAGDKNAAKMPAEAKKPITGDTASGRPRRLDGAPQPPLRTAPAAANTRRDVQAHKIPGRGLWPLR